jgi:hypothetical protein
VSLAPGLGSLLRQIHKGDGRWLRATIPALGLRAPAPSNNERSASKRRRPVPEADMSYKGSPVRSVLDGATRAGRGAGEERPT